MVGALGLMLTVMRDGAALSCLHQVVLGSPTATPSAWLLQSCWEAVLPLQGVCELVEPGVHGSFRSLRRTEFSVLQVVTWSIQSQEAKGSRHTLASPCISAGVWI